MPECRQWGTHEKASCICHNSSKIMWHKNGGCQSFQRQQPGSLLQGACAEIGISVTCQRISSADYTALKHCNLDGTELPSQAHCFPSPHTTPHTAASLLPRPAPPSLLPPSASWPSDACFVSPLHPCLRPIPNFLRTSVTHPNFLRTSVTHPPILPHPILLPLSQVSKAIKASLKNTPEGQAAIKAAKARLESSQAADDAWEVALEEQSGCARVGPGRMQGKVWGGCETRVYWGTGKMRGRVYMRV